MKDDKKRAAYDKYGSASQQPGFDPNAFGQNPFNAGGFAGGFGGGFSGFSGSFGGASQADLFEQIFGTMGGRQSGRARSENVKGQDLEATIGISFTEAAKGSTKTINLTQIVNCSTCTGTGLKSGAKRSACTSCHGTGTRTFVINSGFHMESTCPTCDGTGTTIPRGSQCGSCAGVGKVKQRANVDVVIPAGASSYFSSCRRQTIIDCLVQV